MAVCTFRLINGSVIVLIGGVGFVLCVTVVCCITFNIIHLSEQQNVFVMNVLVCESCIAVIGLLRGMGIISRKWAGVEEEPGGRELIFCHIYPLVSRIFWYSKVPALLPLTIDRFVAVVFPLRHKSWITRRTSLVMITAQWTPCILLVIYQIINFYLGNSQIRYQKFYHRCVLYGENKLINRLDAVVFTITPFIVIAILYAIIIYNIIKSGRNCTKLLFRSSMIVIMCVVAYTPTFILEAGVRMSYTCAQVSTVTLYYVNCVFDPIIYVYSDPNVRGSLRWRVGDRRRRRGAVFNSTIRRSRLPSYQAGSRGSIGTRVTNSSRGSIDNSSRYNLMVSK
ncbi:lysophosphatidic acid receptor 6-like [Bolinopsis microptera]|uniref:lysophosphatidic acid receptor 6-like n=1 Tax=Bolinopsis microptera TaxID=2820187 RepID=UPI00307A7B0C